MISCADAFRSLSGFSETNMLAVLPPPRPPPVKETTFSTAGSFRTICMKRLSFSIRAGNDVSCAAWTLPERRPVSCCGKKPFGMTT